MTQKEKAKRYDEAKLRMSAAYNSNRCTLGFINEIFPELKESEDEKWIPREIAKYLKEKGDFRSCWIAWLEKQGESYTKRDVDDAYLKGVTNAKNEIEKQYEANYQIRKDIATFIFNYRGVIKDRTKWMDYLGIKVSFIEKQREQNHTDNRLIPQKGNYYVCIKDYYSADGKTTNTKGKIYKSPCDGYINDDKGFGLSWTSSCIEAFFSPVKDKDWIVCENDNVIGEPIQYKNLKSNKVLQKAIKKLEDNGFVIKLRLWTIKDVKDGDVLFTSSTASHETFIFKSIDERGNAECYFAYDSEDGFREGKYHFIGSAINCKPATKEQRDTLMKAMADAGYTFDSEKKELKNIEQKPKFRIGDTIKKKSTSDIVTISEIDLKNKEYRLSNTGFIPFKYEHLWELVEQKPTDKVEPKFRIGDVIEVKPMKCHGKIFTGKPNKIVDITEKSYILDDGKAYSIELQDGWKLSEQKPTDNVEPKFKKE